MLSGYHFENAFISSWNVMTKKKKIIIDDLNHRVQISSRTIAILARKKNFRSNMFGFFTAFNSLTSKQREGREALIYENYIRTGQGVSRNKIYRESSADKRVRRELGAIRYKERLQQQIKLIRLMKKLLIKGNDEELEQIRIKVAQLELKIEKAARENDVNCEDMFDMDKPDDAYDIQLEKLIRSTILNGTGTENFQLKTVTEKSKHDTNASGDYVYSGE